MLPLFLGVVWLLVVLVPVLERKAKGKPGGVSILPAFPVFPLAAWGLAALLDLVHDGLGYYLIGGLHVVLLACVIGCSAKYLYEIKRKT
jgi:hypothetical protein